MLQKLKPLQMESKRGKWNTLSSENRKKSGRNTGIEEIL